MRHITLRAMDSIALVAVDLGEKLRSTGRVAIIAYNIAQVAVFVALYIYTDYFWPALVISQVLGAIALVRAKYAVHIRGCMYQGLIDPMWPYVK